MPVALFGLETPPFLALLAAVAFVVFLFRRDIQQESNVTSALWLPVVWMLLVGSRSVGQWLNVFGVSVLGSVEEGSTLDAVVYFGLIAAGIVVLNQRRVTIEEFLHNNGWLVAFLLYCFVAIIWSDFPFVAFKRWIKVLGHPIMALILFTEPDPMEAVCALMKRSAYVLLPFSILLIKYYPDIGRHFDDWGLATNTGVAQSKNTLGCGCMVFGLFFFWQFLRVRRLRRSIFRRNELRLLIGLLVMDAWLLWRAQSVTSVLSLLVAITVLWVLGQPWVNKKLIGTYIILAVMAFLGGELIFGIFGRVAAFTGHDSTIAGRSELWHDAIALQTSVLFGVGFESFWLGDRLKALWETRIWQPTEAHNGYVEIYLDLGIVGLFMLSGFVISTFRKIKLELFRNFEWGRFRMAFLIAILLYNVTEATFKGLSITWFVFYIISIEYPQGENAAALEASRAKRRRDETELSYASD